MGCCLSDNKPSGNDDDDPVKKLGNIIGGDGSRVDIDISTVPERRRSMTEVEVASMKATIYYKKKKVFEREDSLDYNELSGMQELRGFLDEPLGRYYLLVSFISNYYFLFMLFRFQIIHLLLFMYYIFIFNIAFLCIYFYC